MVNIKQGDILKINFNPSLGYEQEGYRPAIVLSTREISRYSNIYIVAPISTTSRVYPAYYEIQSANHTKGKALLDQTISLDLTVRKFRIDDRISKEELTAINHIYKLFFDVD